MTATTGPGADRLLRDRPAVDAARLNGVAWGAILAGAVIALVAQLALSILGLGIGLATVDPASTGTPSATSLSIGAAAWWILSGIVATALGGFVAGRLSGKPLRSTSGYHGLVSWGVTTIVVVFLLSSAVGGILGGAFGAVTSALGGAGQTAAQAAAPSLPGMTDPLAGIEAQIRSASGGQDPAQLREVAAQAIKAAITGDGSQRQQAMDRAADALAKAQNIPADQAKAQVETYRQEYAQAVAQAKDTAVQAADAAAKATSRGALMVVLSLALGAAAAVVGGRFGTVGTAESPGDA